MRRAGRWRLGTRLAGVWGPMAAMCVLGLVRSSRRLTACDVVGGGEGGVLQELFFGPCGHAATSSSSPLIGGAPDPVNRQWLDIPVMRAETCTHSANCADDRRVFPGAAFGPVF